MISKGFNFIGQFTMSNRFVYITFRKQTVNSKAHLLGLKTPSAPT